MFYTLFQQPFSMDDMPSGEAPLSLDQMQTHWLQGGYPDPRLSKQALFLSQWMDQYQDTYIYRDTARLFPKLNKQNYRRFLTMLSQLSGTVINQHNLPFGLVINQSQRVEQLSDTIFQIPVGFL